MGVIYKIVNPKGKVYVGQTYNLKHRIASHKCASKNGGTAIILHNSIKKYGWENHLLEVIEEVPDEMLNEREMFWIATLHTNRCDNNPNGLNMSVGGGGNRHKWMHDTKRRSKASESFTGDNNPFKGKRHTEETKRVIGDKASKRNKESGRTVPQWGAEKGREKVSKKVVAYNLNGDFIAEYKSCSEASRFIGITVGDVSSVCRGEQNHSHGYIFRFLEAKDYPKKIEVKVVFHRNNLPIMLVGDNLMIIKEYKNATEAATELNIPVWNVQRAAKQYKGKPLRSGHRFIYKHDLLNINSQSTVAESYPLHTN